VNVINQGALMSACTLPYHQRENNLAFAQGEKEMMCNRYIRHDQYLALIRRAFIRTSSGGVATCGGSNNAQGEFEFADMANGDFLIGTTIQWNVKNKINSAAFMRQIRIEDVPITHIEFSYRMSGKMNLRPFRQ